MFRKHGLIENTLSMGLITSLSRLFGLVRTILLAHVFGASLIGDLFFLAFKIPNLLRRMFAEGAMSSCFIPLYQEIKKHPPFVGAPNLFFRKTLTMLFLMVLLVVLLGIVTSSFTMKYFFFLTEEQSITDSLAIGSILLKIMFPYLLFVSLAAVLQGILNSHGFFTKPAFTPVILNLAVIISACFALISGIPNEQAAMVIAFSVTFGGLLQLAFLVPSVYRLGVSFKPALVGMNKETNRFFLLLGPVIFSSSIYQINQIIIDPIVVHLGSGAVSALQYSVRLQELPIGIVIVSLTTVALPILSSMTSNKNTYHLQEKINQLFRFVIIALAVIIPVGIIARENIVYLLFKSGQFDLKAVSVTSECLMFHLLALLPIGFHRVLTSVFFALQDTKTPFLISLYSLPITIILAYSLSTIYKMGAPGIALATAGSTFFSVLLLFQYLKKKITFKITRETYFLGAKLLMIVSVFFIFIYILPEMSFSRFLLPQSASFWVEKIARAIDLVALTFIYGLIFLAFAYLLKIQEVFLFFSKVKKKLMT